MPVTTLTAEYGGRTLTIETGRLARLAGGSVTIRYGDTLLLGTANRSEPRPGLDFFPLTVDFEERMYAAGKIPGGFIKRESRPSEAAILAARLTDRPIRPLFPEGYKDDVQIVLTVLSTDRENDPDILGTIAASAALTISEIPFQGPVAAVRVGRIDGQFVINPTFQQLAGS
jgi:polyribonucleotide nucleotidyltransferase